MKEIIKSIKIYLIFTVLLGLVYPLIIAAIAQITMPYQANGSLIIKDGRVIGSELIGQKFDKPEYFNSRPSAVNYNAAGSGASNYGPMNEKLIEQVNSYKKNNKKITADMVMASASGLDPHISIENAMLQLPRVARQRNLPESKVKELVNENTDPDFVGIWGKAGVNVLKLNLTLDSL
ncbi:MAG TPA: potassium-transporting ATPase subunit KdpC [Candidatus Gastranaerophilales bacterium]|nr:potassium-transporting ATPase subunit KdpC [Candidatus Gastranaerophilales bacterium]